MEQNQQVSQQLPIYLLRTPILNDSYFYIPGQTINELSSIELISNFTPRRMLNIASRLDMNIRRDRIPIRDVIIRQLIDIGRVIDYSDQSISQIEQRIIQNENSSEIRPSQPTNEYYRQLHEGIAGWIRQVHELILQRQQDRQNKQVSSQLQQLNILGKIKKGKNKIILPGTDKVIDIDF